MILICLFLCIVSLFILYLRYRLMWTGEIVEAEIVGTEKGAKSYYGITGHNFKLRLEYENEIYYVKSLESVVTFGGEPKKAFPEQCSVYFNPQAPRTVTIKGNHQIEKLGYGILLLAGVGVLLSLSM